MRDERAFVVISAYEQIKNVCISSVIASSASSGNRDRCPNVIRREWTVTHAKFAFPLQKAFSDVLQTVQVVHVIALLLSVYLTTLLLDNNPTAHAFST